MPICSYLVIPRPGAAGDVADRLRALPSCRVESALEHELLILVTDTPGLDEEEDLRRRVESMDEVHALLLAFGEIDPDCPVGDPLSIHGSRRRFSGSQATPSRADGGRR